MGWCYEHCLNLKITLRIKIRYAEKKLYSLAKADYLRTLVRRK